MKACLTTTSIMPGCTAVKRMRSPARNWPWQTCSSCGITTVGWQTGAGRKQTSCLKTRKHGRNTRISRSFCKTPCPTGQRNTNTISGRKGRSSSGSVTEPWNSSARLRKKYGRQTRPWKVTVPETAILIFLTASARKKPCLLPLGFRNQQAPFVSADRPGCKRFSLLHRII